MLKPPNWYNDAGLSLTRVRVMEALREVDRIKYNLPAGSVVTPELHAARYAAYVAELAYVETFNELRRSA